ncbi:histidine kinase [Algoriphagus sp. A40]|uniref:sensor histidine kinase n=1 Tax=Algoriphagus sp. A40 TaxID=1945863 RepID=UPI000987A2CE|nr:histidine kinase [Algoriphagus sp. A40]OOG71112.1 hypothetical protein B0E43_17485 [Algoriphagus sp. A40]
MLSKYPLFFVFLFLVFGKSPAQQLPSRQFTTADGLPNNAIRSLLLDSRGILWIGTENGISKLENGLFQNFYESDGLAFNSCWAISEDKNQHLWFGSYGGGVTFFDGKEFRKIQETDSLADNRIRHFYPYQDFMLVGTEDGISLIDTETLKVTTIASSINNTDLNYTTGFWEESGKLYYSTYRSGSYEIFWENEIPKTRKINDWLPIYAIFQQGDSLLLSDKGSLKAISKEDFLEGKKPEISFGQSIFWDQVPGISGENYLLAAGLFSKDGGIFELNEAGLLDQTARFGVDSKFIQAGALDKERGLLFLGSLDKGLYQVRIDQTVIYEDFGGKEVRGITGKEELLALLHTGGLEIRNTKTGKITETLAPEFKKVQESYFSQFPQKIPKHLDGFFELDPTIPAQEMEFYELHLQQDGFWINTNLGIYHLSLEGKIKTYLPVHCFSMGFTPDGKLIETNPYAGVRIYDNPEEFSFTYFHPDEANTPLQISKVAHSSSKTFLASVFHGFYHWDGQQFTAYRKAGIWDEEKFKTLHVMENGNLLVGTEFGELYRIEVEPAFKELKKWDKDELQGTSILALESYGESIIAVTEKGIHLLQGDKNSFRDEEQGFFQKVFLSAKRIGDDLYLGSTKGFYRISLPDFVKSQTQSIRLGITEFKVNHIPLNPDDFEWFIFQPKKLQLEADQNTLYIRFKPTGPIESGKLRYKYRLKSDAEWTEFFNEPVMELPYLPWGIYQLEVEVWDYHSGDMSRVNLLEFEIKKPFYLKAWFIALLFLGMAGLFTMIYRIRSSQFKAKTSMNQRLTEIKLEALRSQMNPHFTFNAINSIQYYILKNDTNQALNYLGMFSALIRITLDQSSKTQISLAEELDYLRKYIEVENMRMDHRVDWQIEGNAIDKAEEIFISPMLIQPLVENVFVHAFPGDYPSPKLRIRYDLGEKNSLICTVEDNGIGISNTPKPNHESKGTRLIREKLMLLPGNTEDSLMVETGNWGTKVRMRIYL